jgi:hypothetical protein
MIDTMKPRARSVQLAAIDPRRGPGSTRLAGSIFLRCQRERFARGPPRSRAIDPAIDPRRSREESIARDCWMLSSLGICRREVGNSRSRVTESSVSNVSELD